MGVDGGERSLEERGDWEVEVWEAGKVGELGKELDKLGRLRTNTVERSFAKLSTNFEVREYICWFGGPRINERVRRTSSCSITSLATTVGSNSLIRTRARSSTGGDAAVLLNISAIVPIA